jgi:hypothetical protein
MKKTVCLVCIVRNESDYIFEWTAHYRSLGLLNIIFYDNQSTDRTTAILERWQKDGIAAHIPWESREGVSPQISAYSDALLRLRHSYEFVAFFDADEFLTPLIDFDITSWLAALAADIGAIAINQRVFGSSGHKKHEPGLVIERFQNAAEPDYDENLWVKSIYRFEAVKEIQSPHRGQLRHGRYILPDGSDAFGDGRDWGKARAIDRSRLQLNHYIIKSEEEFLRKRQRGGVMGATHELRLSRYEDVNFFYGRDARINRALDDTLFRRKSEIEDEMRKLPGEEYRS